MQQPAAPGGGDDGQQPDEDGAANGGSALRFRRTPLEARLAAGVGGSAGVMQQLFGTPDTADDGAPSGAGHTQGPTPAASGAEPHAEAAQQETAGAAHGRFRSGLLDDGFYSESEPQAHAGERAGCFFCSLSHAPHLLF